DTSATFDGMPAAMVVVYRVGDQKPLAVSDTVLQYIKDKQSKLPDSIHLAAWNDNSELYQSRLNLLLKNAGIGLVLVFVVLGLFLQIRLAIWVMLGIPISFLGALLLMPGLGVSVNMISLFAFIMALGIVVDDAIVVGENIFEHRLRGKSNIRAAIDGAKEVAIPVTFSILTSVAAFLPLLFVVGTMGQFIKVIPMVVISILVISLVESFFVLPSHLSLTRNKGENGKDQPLKPIKRKKFSIMLDKFVHGPYRKALSLCITYRYINIALAVATLFLTIGLVKGGIIKFTFMPVVDGDKIQVSLQMPLGTLVKNTGNVTEHLVETGMETVRHFNAEREKDDTILRHIYAVTGGTMAGDGPRGGEATSGAHLGNIAMLLAPSDKRNLAATDIANHWRKLAGEIPGVDQLTYSSNLIHMGANIDVQFSSKNYDTLVSATKTLKDALKKYPGVYDIADSYPLGKKELKVRLKPEARSLGITEAMLARSLRSAFYGAEALRLQRGRNEVKVMVRYPTDQRVSLNDLDNMRIRTPGGIEIPLHRAASIEEGRGFSVINRADRKRVINITASVDDKTANAEEILDDLKTGTLNTLINENPDLSYNLEGEEKEKRDSQMSMRRGFLIALLAIYSLLAIPLRSYSQPLLIMIAIPFGVVGAIFGHVIMGFHLSMLSIFGIVALSGVVVNDSLLLIDYINHSRRKGATLHEAVNKAGLRRFRPILLTSLTTFFGLMPMMLEKSVQAKFLIPMAISLGFGIIFATMITLLLIPSIYMVAEDIRNLIGLRPTYHRLNKHTD
ncbi:MAG: efflux RND transporter permease subunit, partial [Desulfobulbaceae bacterium]|nr:efflux RND transporter permease subunit [Desulfobulbaceae bacterium]